MIERPVAPSRLGHSPEVLGSEPMSHVAVTDCPIGELFCIGDGLG